MDSHQGKSLGITQAAKMLGIHPLTLRNWAEKGHISFYRTPGGHRRFWEKDLVNFMAKMSQGSPESTLVTVTHQAVQRAIATFPQQHPQVTQPVWQMNLSEQQRMAMRSIGRKLLGVTIQYAAGTADESVLNKGREIGSTYGRFVRHHNLALSEAVATFNFFRDTIFEVTFDTHTDAVEIDTSRPQLYRRLNHFFNEVMLAMIRAAEEALTEKAGRNA
jgi:excisionase family DNA binding protein